MQRTTFYRRDGIVAPSDLIRTHRGGAARPAFPPEPIAVEPIDALADLNRAWGEWASSAGAHPAA